MAKNAFRGCCQVGVILGHDADECRVSVTDRGGVACFSCGRVYPQLTAETVKALEALLSAHPKYPFIEAPQVNDLGLSVRFDANGLVYASVTWHSEHDLDAAERSASDFGRPFNQSEFGSTIPASIAKAAEALCAQGFRVTGPNFADGETRDDWFRHNLRTIILVRGNRPVPGKSAVNGIKVELSYIV